MFFRNTKILVELVQKWQNFRLKTAEQNQFLGDMFENFLDAGVKQSEGQYFTPLPICKFIISSLPFSALLQSSSQGLRAIDYACGAGHFLTEYAQQLRTFIEAERGIIPEDYDKNIVGIEKEDRLAKVAKVAAYMYGHKNMRILGQDALAKNETLGEGKEQNILDSSFDVLVSNPPYSVKGFLQTLHEKQRANYELSKTTDKKLESNNIQCFFIERARQLMGPGGVVGLIVPSSILSNDDAAHIRTREILLEYFDIVALVELGSGAFGQTGTQTVVLFLRRKAQQPEAAEHYKARAEDYFDGSAEEEKTLADEAQRDPYCDAYLLEKYCEQRHLPLAEYRKFLTVKVENIEEIAPLLQNESFAEYQRDFEPGTEIARLKKKKRYRELDEAEQKLERDSRFLNYLRSAEKDKLYYFMLASHNPQPVLLVKSPQDNKKQKEFLGYSWSQSKGNEGIQYMGGSTVHDIQTELFNPKDLADRSKINTLIADNFNGAPPRDLADLPYKDYIDYLPTVELLDFSRPKFNKNFSLATRKNLEVQSRWPFVKLGDVAEVRIGGTPSRKVSSYFQGKNLWVSIAEMKGQVITDTKEKLSDEGVKSSNVKLVPRKTTLLSFKLSIGKTAIAGKDLYTNEAIAALIPFDKGKLTDQYL
ncbi:MAG: N-6 DNA methylase, partial [Spirochaetota bacterium]